MRILASGMNFSLYLYDVFTYKVVLTVRAEDSTVLKIIDKEKNDRNLIGIYKADVNVL